MQLRNAFIFVGIVWEMFNSLESISPVDNMAAPGWGVYVSSGSFQWMGRWRLYQEEHKELLSIIDHLNGSTATHSGRKTTGETSDVIGMWIEITWAKAVVICLLLSVNLLFSSQITRPHVGQVYEQGEPTANRGRRIGLEDHLLSFDEITRLPAKGGSQGQAEVDRAEVSSTAKRGREIGSHVNVSQIMGHYSIEKTHFGRGQAEVDRAEVSSTTKRGREIGSEDLQGQFGRTREDVAAQLGVSVSTFKHKCRKNGIKQWSVSLRSGDTIRDIFDGENDWSIENDSIAETSETPTIVPVIDRSAMSTVYRNPNPLLSVQPQVPLPLTQMESENLGGPLVSMQPWATQMASENLGSPLVSLQPQVPWTQMASENLGGPLVSMQPWATQMASENLGSPFVSLQPQVQWTQMSSENLGGPLVSMQPWATQMASENLGSPLVSLQPQVPWTQMASKNLGSFDDGRTYLGLQAQQDTWFVMIKAMYGKDTILLFPFPVASGIIGLKGEVSKRLKFEVDSFDIKYEYVGDLILIACDEDLFFYLNNISKPLDDLVFKVVVISKTPN